MDLWTDFEFPDAVGQFTIKEWCDEAVYRRMTPERKAALTQTEKTGITLGGGIIAVSLYFKPVFSNLSELTHLVLGPCRESELQCCLNQLTPFYQK